MNREELDFKNGNPGAVQHGNFINYYQFHSPEQRINLLPKNLLDNKKNANYILDVGCNTGDLTVALYEHLIKGNPTDTYCNILGIDIDPVLIKRAKEKTIKSGNIMFQCINIMNETEWNHLIETYFNKNTVTKFDVVFCFSITMWIHLNNGDTGLEAFLKRVSETTKVLVIEPQPWKCYKQAVKRLKLANMKFSHFKELKIRENVEDEIKNYLIDSCNMKLEFESERTTWGRKLLKFSFK